MVLVFFVRVKVVYFVSVKVDPFLSRWSTFLINSFWEGGHSFTSENSLMSLRNECDPG